MNGYGSVLNCGGELRRRYPNTRRRAAVITIAQRGAPARLREGFSAGVALLLWIFVGACTSPQQERMAAARNVSYTTRTMGTYANVTLVTTDSAGSAPLAAGAQAAFHRVDSLMSNWTQTSEVARINREAARGPVTVHPEVLEVLAAAVRVGELSGGAYDITVEPLVRLWGFLGGSPHVPDDEAIRTLLPKIGLAQLELRPDAGTLRFKSPDIQIDLGGIAKGYGVDAASKVLLEAGVVNALVDISGNMMALGHAAGRDHWLIGIRDPRGKSPFIARVRLNGRGISTSGAYEQFVAQGGRSYGHILNPRTGYPAEGLIAVTVVAPTALVADSWDTALFVLGPVEARRVAKSLPDLDAILIEPGDEGLDTVWVEAPLRERFELEPADAARFRVIYF